MPIKNVSWQYHIAISFVMQNHLPLKTTGVKYSVYKLVCDCQMHK